MIADTVVDMPLIVDRPSPIPEGITYWYGEATGSWWALLPGRWSPRLVEAVSEDALAVMVAWHLRMSAP